MISTLRILLCSAVALAAAGQDPASAPAGAERADQLERMGDFAGAARALESLIAKEPNNVQLLLRSGKLWTRSTAFEQAERNISKATALEPKNRDAWLALGQARFGAQQYNIAIEAFDRAGELGNADGQPDNGKGASLFFLGEREEAKRLFLRSAEQNPGLIGPRHMLARIALDEGDATIALRWLDECLRLDPRDPESRFRRGLALRKLDRPTEAIADFRAAILEEPTHLGARLNLGQTLMAAGKEAEGRAEIESHGRVARDQQRLTFAMNSLRLDPQSASARAAVGEALLELGLAAEALQQFRESLRGKRPPANAALGAARACLALGEKKAARQYAERAIGALTADPAADPRDLAAARKIADESAAESRPK